MRKIGFKKKVGKPMKKVKLKKVSKMPISLLQRKIWELLRQIAVIIYPTNCYTCSQRNLEGSNKQLGHLWAKASLGAFLKYDIRVLRWQCFSCNIHKGGCGADFYTKMLKENGQEYMDNLQKERQITVNAYTHYLKLFEELKTHLSTLQENNKSNIIEI